MVLICSYQPEKKSVQNAGDVKALAISVLSQVAFQAVCVSLHHHTLLKSAEQFCMYMFSSSAITNGLQALKAPADVEQGPHEAEIMKLPEQQL